MHLSQNPAMGTEWISEKRSGLDIYSSNLISINLTDFMSWQEIKGFDKSKFREAISIHRHLRDIWFWDRIKNQELHAPFDKVKVVHVLHERQINRLDPDGCLMWIRTETISFCCE